MADKYWTGDGSNTNWNSSPKTNWANASFNGSNGNQTAPAAGDRVFFDANSGTGAAVWNVSISLTGLDCTGSRNLVTHNSGITLTFTAGNVILPTGAGATYTAGALTSTFTFSATSGTQQFNTNGFQITGFTRSGVGGTTQLTSNCSCQWNTTGAGPALTGGTLDLNGYTLTTAAFTTSGTGVRQLTGSGAIIINNTAATAVTVLSVAGSNFSLTGLTAPITFSGQHDGQFTVAFNALSWPAVTFLGNGSYAGGLGKGQYVLGATNNTLASLTINAPNNVILPASNTQTITGALNTVGSYGNYVFLAAPANTPATLSIGSASSLNYCLLRGITFSGAGAAAGLNAIDLGCNTNATLTPPAIGIGRSRLALGY